MIDAKDLRIGNLVTALGWEVMVVESILSSTYRAFLHTADKEYLADFALSDVNPIPLDEKWLERLGFVEIKDDNPKQKPQYEGDKLVEICGFQFSNSSTTANDRSKDRGWFCWEINNGDTVLRYVHDLQNFVRAWTGNELTIL